MQVKKKNIMICSMIVLLFVIGYAYNSFTSDRLAKTDHDLDAQVINSDKEKEEDYFGKMTDEYPGNEQLGGAAVIEDMGNEAVKTAGASFFSEYRIEREKNRSKEVEMWQDVINSEKAEENFKNMAQQELVKIVTLTDKEMLIENLIVAKGFNDALVFLTDDSATVIVEAKELTPSNIAQIQDIVVRKTKLEPKNIKIMKKN
ncbi:MAG TPA: SpoIIIAH-like family protein [Bacillota bacterium]|nr:SpoIIIAH-like family protein [Bacillota bacterium]